MTLRLRRDAEPRGLVLIRLATAIALLVLGGCGGSPEETPAPAPGWETPQALGSTDYVGSLSGDGSGNASLVWLAPATSDLGGPIVARRFLPRTGWGPTETIDPAGSRIFQSPVAGTDPQGRTIVLWPEGSGLFTSRLTDAGWGEEARISRDYGRSFQAQETLGLSSTGSALALWSAGTARLTEVAANRFDPASGWGSPEVVWAAGADDLSNPALAVAPSGIALAAWAEGFGPQRRLWWTTFDPRRGWAVAQVLGLAVAPERQIYGIRVALNASGRGLIAWTQDDTAFVSRYSIPEGPATPLALGQGAWQGLGVDPQGNALALVNQPLGQPAGLILWRLVAGRDSWEQLRVGDEAGGVGTLGLDVQGNAWVLWCDRRGVSARRFVPTDGLLPAQQISASPDGTIPQVLADAAGGGLAVWVEVTGSPYVIRAARYTPR